MFSRKGRNVAGSRELADAFRALVETVERVEGAKAALLAAVPGGRRAGTPLAEALAAFEHGLEMATSLMAGWRAEAIPPHWDACAAALRESAARAEHLRLVATPEGYEQLYGTLGDLMEPLEAFGEALASFRRLGRA